MTITRMQVARILGRSLATVRRLEGQALFPRRDARGVWRFNEKKVRALAEKVRRGTSLAALLKPVRDQSPFATNFRTIAEPQRLRLSRDIEAAIRALRAAQRTLKNGVTRQ